LVILIVKEIKKKRKKLIIAETQSKQRIQIKDQVVLAGAATIAFPEADMKA
jgi:hypothetical protein